MTAKKPTNGGADGSTTHHTSPQNGKSPHTSSGISGNQIKLAACAAMLTDHVGYVLADNNPILRHIGRVAFPLFVFLLIEGWCYTKDARRYLLRLALFGLLSEVPFDLALYHSAHDWKHSNVMWTLLLGFVCMSALDALWNRQRAPHGSPHAFFLEPALLVACFLAADAFHTDYHSIGVLAIVIGFACRRFGAHRCIEYAAICAVLLLNGFWEAYALMGLPLIALYRGAQGRKSKLLQYAFYAFYPAHLTGIFLVYLLLHR